MTRFIKETDYGMLIKREIQSILVNGYDDPKLMQAERAAIDQMTNFLCGRYKIDMIFNSENRDEFIVMTLIDLALYHLYSSKSANEIPEHRSQRYEDAISWLKGVSKGHISANLPKIDNNKCDIRINSNKKRTNRW